MTEIILFYDVNLFYDMNYVVIQFMKHMLHLLKVVYLILRENVNV